MDETPMMLPPCGHCFAICCAAACTAKNAPFKLVPIVKLTRSGDMLKDPSICAEQNLRNGNIRQKICKLAYASVAHEDVEAPELFDRFRDELLSSFWFSDISRYSDDSVASVASFSDQTLELCG
jgi:hypothetical protein